MANQLNRIEPPALPLAPEQYDRPYQDQSNNVLRLFFNRLVGLVREIISTDDGGKFLYMPRGLFYSTVDQTLTLANTGYPVEFENIYIDSGTSIVNDTKITIAADGIYNFQISIQLESTSATAKTVWVWINKNGTDVPYGAHEYVIEGNGQKEVVIWNFSIDVEAGQYIEMYWAADDTDIEIHTHAPTSPHPGVPSTVVAVSFVSNL